MIRNKQRDIEYNSKKAHRIRTILAIAKVRAGCAMCGYNGHSAAPDFNHFKGDKRKDITKMSTYSWESIINEIKKCVVLCANCHRIYTRQQAQGKLMVNEEFVRGYIQKSGQ